MATAEKIRYDRSYWIEKLIGVGMDLEPWKYTTVYITEVKAAWENQPLTRLVHLVMMRKEQLNQISK